MTAELRKPFRSTWADSIPRHWDHVKLGRVSRIFAGGTPDKKRDDFWENGTIPWVNSGAVNQRLIVEASDFITEAGYKGSSAAWAPKGSLVMALAGQGKTKGMVAQMAIDATCNQSMAAIVLNNGNPRYFLYWLISNYRHIRGMASDDLRDGLNLAIVNQIPCPVPPLHEQSAIASYLDVETARIDALIAEKRGLLNALEQLKTTRITQVLTGAERPSINTDNEWLPTIPQGWSLVRLKFLGQVRSGIAKGKKYEGTPMVEVPYLRVANVQDGYLDLSSVSLIEVSGDEAERYALKPCDVLMNEGGDFDKVGRGAMWSGEVSPCIHQNHVFAVRLDDESIAPWLAAITRTAYAKFYFMNNAKQSTNLASISQGNVKEFPVVLPPAAERGPLLQRLNEELVRLSDLAEHARKEMDLLAELRSTTITDAVLGRIDVRATVQNNEELEAA